MKNSPLDTPAADDLRYRAEERLANRSAVFSGNEDDLRKLLHELQMRQIELEIQQEALLEAQAGRALAQVHAVFNASPDACLLIDTDGRILFANRCVEKMFGYTCEELLALDINALVPQRMRAGHKHLLGEFVRQRQSRTMGTRGEPGGIRKDGSEFPIEVSLSSLEIDGKHMAIAVVRDTSELYAAHEAMRIANEFFENTFDSAPVGMGIVDSAGGFVKVNPAICRIVGYSEEELLTKSPLDITHPVDAATNADLLQSLWAGEIPSFQMEKRYLHKDGREIWVLLVVSMISDKNGQPLYTIGQMLDIDRQKRAEQQLRLSEERLRSIFENTNTGIAATDASGRIVAFNEAFVALLGYDEDILRTMNFANITHPDDLAREYVFFNEVLSGRRDHYRMEKRYKRSDGNPISVDISASAIRDAQGQVVNFIAVVSDITERKQAESFLIESRQQLRSLSVYQEGLLEEERKRIACEVHDELGQLLTALKMDISLLRLRFVDDPDLLDKLERMRALVSKTIQVVRHVASNLRPAALDLGLAPAIEWLAEDFSQHREIPCKVDLSGGDIAFDDGMATAIFRVVQESLTNVARHAQASEVRIVLNIGDRLVLLVKDDGCGFDPAVVSRKAGFGLLGMRERILALGGTLKIDSALGAGTTLAIELPLLLR